MFITTITPALYPLCVRQGVSEFSDDFVALTSALLAACPQLRAGDWNQSRRERDGSDTPAPSLRSAYADISRDDRDLRLAWWQGELASGQALTVHFFNNQLAVFEIDFERLPSGGDDALDDWSERRTREVIAEFDAEVMRPLLQNLAKADIPNLQICWRSEREQTRGLWVGRCLRLISEEVAQAETEVRGWLCNTIRPEDAEDIIARRSDDSLRWLNYVLVEERIGKDHHKLEAMILAQYFYSVQHMLNGELFRQISDVFQSKNLNSKEAHLRALRADAQLHVSTYYEALNYLTRSKKELLIGILQAWEFQAMLDNTERMIKVCSTRLDEINSAKRSRAEVMTDVLLAIIGFFAIFDLVLQFVSYSREMVTNPTLGFVDESVPWILVLVARWNIDVVLLVSLLAVSGLAWLYAKVKNQ